MKPKCQKSSFTEAPRSHLFLSNVILTELLARQRIRTKEWGHCFSYCGVKDTLLGNDHNIHVRNSRRTVFYTWSAPRPLLCNVSVNTPLQQ
jgi:hypothetical protein